MEDVLEKKSIYTQLIKANATFPRWLGVDSRLKPQNVRNILESCSQSQENVK